MGHIFFLCPLVLPGSLTLAWRGLCHSRGALPFFFNALDVHRGWGIPKASPKGVTHPHLMAFFAIELAQGGNLRFSNSNSNSILQLPLHQAAPAGGTWLPHGQDSLV